MTLNYLEIDKLISEWNIKGSRLQKVIATDYDTFLLSFYKTNSPETILIGTGKNPRVFKTENRYKKLGSPHNLVEFFKAYLVGCNVDCIEQINQNRIVKITLSNSSSTYYLYIRLWGGFSNIIITDKENKILHLHKKSSKKEELPQLTFKLPEARVNTKNYQLDDISPYESFNKYIEFKFNNSIFTENAEKEANKVSLLKEKKERELRGKIKSLNKKLETYKNNQEYKLYGDLLKSNLFRLKRGDKEVTLFDYTTNNQITIKLKPELDPNGNSEYYYKQFKKAENGLEVVKNNIKELENVLSNLDNLYNTSNDLEKQQNQNSNKNPQRPGLTYFSGDWEILVGRNSKENESLLRHYVKGNDMWFHVRDFPGGYVVIKSKKNRTFPLNVLKDAGTLAIFYSKAKNNGKTDVQYTPVKNLRKIKNGKPGQVIVNNDKNLTLPLDKEILNRLKLNQ